MPKLITILALVFPLSALGQSGATDEWTAVDARASDEDRWTLGVGVSAKDSPYAGEGVRVRPFPYVVYEGEHVYWRGDTFGVHLARTTHFTLDAVVEGRFDGFDRDDLGRRELAENGVDATRLDDRDDTADAGVAARWAWGGHALDVGALADITDTSGGYELSADYSYRIGIGRGTIMPGVGVRWLSDDLANYYYGVRAEETFAGAEYRPDAALVPQAGVAFVYPLAGKWRVRGLVQYEWLPDELADSPLLERGSDAVGHVVIGVARTF